MIQWIEYEQGVQYTVYVGNDLWISVSVFPCIYLYLCVFLMHILVYWYVYVTLCVCVSKKHVILCLCVQTWRRAVSFGLAVSIIRSLSFTSVSFSLSPSLSSRISSLSLPLLCPSDWWLLNHPFILCTVMKEGKSVLFSLLFCVPSLSFCSCFIHPTPYPDCSTE